MPLRADTLWIGRDDGAASGLLELKDARITGIEGDKILFRTKEGSSSSREIDRVRRIAVEGEPALTAAEDALAAEKLDAAVDGFLRVLRSASSTAGAAGGKSWLANWSSRRLETLAERTGRFDAAVAAYIARVQLVSDKALAIKRPELPSGRSTYLDTAVKDVEALLGNNKLSSEQRVALLGFLVDLHRARDDAKSADAAAEKLDDLLAKDPNNPTAGRAIARRKLQTAQAALDRKDFRQALADLEASRALFDEPQQQADALFLIAGAHLGLAGQNPDKLRDAALAYMRVVAHFKDSPGRPRVAESLVKVAQIHEQLGEPQTALHLYEQFVAAYPDHPLTPSARQSIDRIRQAGATTKASGTPR